MHTSARFGCAYAVRVCACVCVRYAVGVFESMWGICAVCWRGVQWGSRARAYFDDVTMCAWHMIYQRAYAIPASWCKLFVFEHSFPPTTGRLLHTKSRNVRTPYYWTGPRTYGCRNLGEMRESQIESKAPHLWLLVNVQYRLSNVSECVSLHMTAWLVNVEGSDQNGFDACACAHVCTPRTRTTHHAPTQRMAKEHGRPRTCHFFTCIGHMLT